MRHSLFDRVTVIPYTSGAFIARMGLLSAVLGINCSAVTGEAALAVTVTHCDTADGEYTPVDDPRIFVDTTVPLPLDAIGYYQVPIDLIGCKEFVQIEITVTGEATCAYALALGDADAEPLS